MRSKHSGLMAAITMMAMTPALVAASDAVNRPSPARALRDAFGSAGSWSGRTRAKGWSVASDRRRAKKARNVARNRLAHKA